MTRPTFLLLVAVLAACTPPSSQPPREVAYRPETLENALAGLPTDTSPTSTIQRSRVLRALGRQGEAVRQLEESLEQARLRLDWRGMSDAWRELGDVQIEMARPQDALDTYAKRLTNAKSLDATRDRAFAQVDMAYAFVFLSQWTPAQHALEDAEVLAKSDLEADPESLEKMAYVREKLLAREVAIDLLDRARAEYAQQGDASGEARTAIARAYLLAIEHETSAPLDGSLDVLAARSRDPEARARLLRYRGETAYLFDKQYPRCLALAEEGLPLAERRGNQNLAKGMNILVSVCAGKLGNVPRAIATAQKAVAYSEDEWQSTSVPSARQAVGFEALLLYRHILELDVKLPERERVAAAFDAMEKARGRAYLDAAVRGGANLLASSAEVPPLLAADKKQVEAHLAEIDKEIVAGKDDREQLERRRDALWALDDVRAAIAYHNPLITRLAAPRPATLSRARQLLDDKTMLVAFLMTNDQAVAIAVTTTSERLYVIDGGPNVLAADVAALRDDELTDPHAPLDEVRGKAGALYRKLLGPVKDLVDAHERIIVLPHGALAMLPFEALVDDSGKFLVENHEVTYSESATLALEDAQQKPPAGARRGFVGLGDPVYDWADFAAHRAEGVPADGRGLHRYLGARTTASRGARFGLERLPGTARE
ncbi:MAG: CHAT domain-containing protein, partial [Acidobacteriota bacterium]